MRGGGLQDEKIVENALASRLPPSESELFTLKKESDVAKSEDTVRVIEEEKGEQGYGDEEEEQEEARSSGGTVMDVFAEASRAVTEAPVESVVQVAFFSGVGGLALLFSSSLLEYLEALPLLPHITQVIGFFYCTLVLSYFSKTGRFEIAPSPFATLSLFLGGPQSLPSSESPSPPLSQAASGSRPPQSLIAEGLEGKAGVRIRELAKQRDAAVAQVEKLKKAGQDMGRVVAEKEALEAVAMQLAEERDNAISEVTALKAAVNAMTERMRSIEAMLAQEVERLQQQNFALETVALQLADERDSAIKQAEELRTAFETQRIEDKRVLEMLASQLIEERNEAMKEVEELQHVVATLRESSESSSGLTPEMETFIKSRARSVRSQFVDITKSYEEQKEAVDAFVSHLVEEYGAPIDWTQDYIRHFLNSSADSVPALNAAPFTEKAKWTA